MILKFTPLSSPKRTRLCAIRRSNNKKLDAQTPTEAQRKDKSPITDDVTVEQVTTFGSEDDLSSTDPDSQSVDDDEMEKTPRRRRDLGSEEELDSR